MNATYAHCQHCCWNHPAHVAEHTTPCGSWCADSVPVEQDALFEVGAA